MAGKGRRLVHPVNAAARNFAVCLVKTDYLPIFAIRRLVPLVCVKTGLHIGNRFGTAFDSAQGPRFIYRVVLIAVFRLVFGGFS